MQYHWLRLHDALPILPKEGTQREELDFASDDKVEKRQARFMMRLVRDLNTEELSGLPERSDPPRSEEHTSELQSPCNIVCRLVLAKKNADRKQKAVTP